MLFFELENLQHWTERIRKKSLWFSRWDVASSMMSTICLNFDQYCMFLSCGELNWFTYRLMEIWMGTVQVNLLEYSKRHLHTVL